jgi:hypothetical protein
MELYSVEKARDLVSWNARQAYPPKPDCVDSGWVKVIRPDIDTDTELWAATKSGARLAPEHMAEVHAWVRNCQKINIRFGLPELESTFKAAWDKQWTAFARFIQTPATTLAGLAVRTSAIFYFEDRTRRAWRGMATDQMQLEPEQQILLTLRRDLLGMAGLPADFAMEYVETAEQQFITDETSQN